MALNYVREFDVYITFTGVETEKNVQLDINSFSIDLGYNTQAYNTNLVWGMYVSNQYQYYAVTGSYGPYEVHKTISTSIQYSSWPYITADVELYFEFHAPSNFSELKKITFTGVHVQNISDGVYCFAVMYPNTNGSDTNVVVLRAHISNPPFQTYEYYIHLLSDGSEITSAPIRTTYQTRDETAPLHKPTDTVINDARNAESAGIQKTGYKAMGWDTSSSAQTVVYGGEGSGSLIIPGDVIPYTNQYGGLFLYSVWKRKDVLFVYINNQPVSVAEVRVVTGVNQTTQEAITAKITSGKVRVGSSWKQFEL